MKNNLEMINDSYTLAITAYAMELANDEMKQIVLTELMKKSVREGKGLLNKFLKPCSYGSVR